MHRFGPLSLAVLLVGFAACQKGGKVQHPPLVVAIDLWPGYYPVLLAKDLGYFEQANLAVDIRIPENTDRMLGEFDAGINDIIAVALGDLVPLTREGSHFKVILVSDESTGDAVVSLKPLPEQPSDFEGLRIATNLSGFGELFLLEMLRHYGVEMGRITLVNSEASQIPAGLEAQFFDAGHTWQPYVSLVLDAGGVQWFSSRQAPGLILDVVAVNDRVLKSRPDDIRKFTAAWLKALDWWQSNPEAGWQKIDAILGERAGPHFSDACILQDLNANRERFEGEGPGSLTHSVQKFSSFFLDRGTLSKPVDPALILDGRFLP
ncbi:MAG: ABC transporter substrate-binding protein [Acidobacteria bacterium]|nr:ABC transporter substrate-binding protein [Acidobacteriota bacterium]MCB9398842.1 ABC transporter substrate-binding protein [Acidobacteriota bacterium]